jgi:uncharacterized membrane protein YphA (DoxX/SURF4 family)
MMDQTLAAGRIALGAILVNAAAVKIPDMAAFAADVANYRLAPAAAVPFLVSAVVGVELLAGLALVAGVAARGAALVAGGLLGVFMVALSQALLRGIDLRCGCFGGQEPASWWRVAEDAGLLLLAVAVALRGPGRLTPGRPAAEAAAG